MRDPLARDHVALEVEDRKHGVTERDVQPERHPAADVDLEGDVRPADGLRPGSLGGLAHEPGHDQVRGQPAHRRRAEPDQPGYRAAGDRAVIQDGL